VPRISKIKGRRDDMLIIRGINRKKKTGAITT